MGSVLTMIQEFALSTRATQLLVWASFGVALFTVISKLAQTWLKLAAERKFVAMLKQTHIEATRKQLEDSNVLSEKLDELDVALGKMKLADQARIKEGLLQTSAKGRAAYLEKVLGEAGKIATAS